MNQTLVYQANKGKQYMSTPKSFSEAKSITDLKTRKIENVRLFSKRPYFGYRVILGPIVGEFQVHLRFILGPGSILGLFQLYLRFFLGPF